jgi:predicted RNase H-like HicB family nuclease
MAEHDLGRGVPETLQAQQRRARYITATVAGTEYKVLDDGSVFGEIPGFQGVWANAAAEAACRTELRSVLDGWLTLRLNWHDLIPSQSS